MQSNAVRWYLVAQARTAHFRYIDDGKLYSLYIDENQEYKSVNSKFKIEIESAMEEVPVLSITSKEVNYLIQNYSIVADCQPEVIACWWLKNKYFELFGI